MSQSVVLRSETTLFPPKACPGLWGALGEPWEALGQLWEGLGELWDSPVGLHIYQKLPINRPSGHYVMVHPG